MAAAAAAATAAAATVAAAAATAAVADLKEEFRAASRELREQSQQRMEEMMTANHELQARLQNTEVLLAAATSSAEADRARTMFPSNLSLKVDARVQVSKDCFPLIREAISLLMRDVPDVAQALVKMGQVYRLNNNMLAGADLSKLVPDRPFEFIEGYYGETKSFALRRPLEGANWSPENELVKHDAARKTTEKVLAAAASAAAAAAARAAAAAARAAAYNTGPRRAPGQNYQYQPYPRAPPPPPPAQQQQQQLGGGQQKGGNGFVPRGPFNRGQ